MTQGVTGTSFSVDHIMADVQNFPNKIYNTVDQVAADLNNAVNQITSSLMNVPTSFLQSSISQIVHNATTDLRLLQSMFDVLLANVTTIVSSFKLM